MVAMRVAATRAPATSTVFSPIVPVVPPQPTGSAAANVHPAANHPAGSGSGKYVGGESVGIEKIA